MEKINLRLTNTYYLIKGKRIKHSFFGPTFSATNSTYVVYGLSEEKAKELENDIENIINPKKYAKKANYLKAFCVDIENRNPLACKLFAVLPAQIRKATTDEIATFNSVLDENNLAIKNITKIENGFVRELQCTIMVFKDIEKIKFTALNGSLGYYTINNLQELQNKLPNGRSFVSGYDNGFSHQSTEPTTIEKIIEYVRRQFDENGDPYAGNVQRFIKDFFSMDDYGVISLKIGNTKPTSITSFS